LIPYEEIVEAGVITPSGHTSVSPLSTDEAKHLRSQRSKNSGILNISEYNVNDRNPDVLRADNQP